MHWKIPKMWPGSTVYILGGGPSLKHVDIDRLRGQSVIAVNNSYQLARWIPVMYFMDCTWFTWHAEELADWPGIRVTSCANCRDISWIKYLGTGHRSKFDDRAKQMTRGTNAGFGAMVVGIKLGGTKFFLLGFDMRSIDGKANWHEDHERQTPENIYENQFFKSFASIKGDLKKRGIEVINATPGSALTTFPIISPEEAYP